MRTWRNGNSKDFITDRYLMKELTRKEYGQRFYTLRKKQELTQEEFAFLMWTSAKKVASLEKWQRWPHVNEMLRVFRTMMSYDEFISMEIIKPETKWRRGYPKGRPRKVDPKIEERNNEMAKKRMLWATYAEIAEEYGVSRQRVAQILG